MPRLICLAFLAVLAAPFRTDAQISLQLSMKRDTLLLFESIPVVVTVHNVSAHPIELTNQDGAPWLKFLVTDESGASLSPLGSEPAPESVKIAPGHNASVTMNLVRRYDLRQHGVFIVRAVVESEGIHALSAPTKFAIINGREIWKQTIGLPLAAGETNEEYRTYSLLSRRAEHDEVLYVSVQDEPHDLVYGVIALGTFIPLGEPSASIDNGGHLHVLYRSGPRSISYAEVGPDARMPKRIVYSDVLSVPQLVTEDDGRVLVHGGEQVYPHVERVMTDDELKPRPPPPPAKPRKKKWWWPFGSSNNTTNPATTLSASADSQK